MAVSLKKVGNPMELFADFSEGFGGIAGFAAIAARNIAEAQRKVAELRNEALEEQKEFEAKWFGLDIPLVGPDRKPKGKPKGKRKAAAARDTSAAQAAFEDERMAEFEAMAESQDAIDATLEMNKRLRREETAAQWESTANELSAATSQMSQHFGQFFVDLIQNQKDAGKTLLTGLLGQLGDIAISHGVIAMKVAFAEAYQSSGASLAQIAPAALLIAAGTALKAGQVLSSSGGSSSGGGFSGRISAPSGSGRGDRFTTVNVNLSGFIGNDPNGFAETIERSVRNATREKG